MFIGSSTCIARHESAFHAAVFNPVDPSLIATANSKKGVQLWDVRVPIRFVANYLLLSILFQPTVQKSNNIKPPSSLPPPPPLHFFILTSNILRKTLEHHNEVFAVAEKSLSTDIKR